MLHPLNPPSCEAALLDLIDLQRRVLEYASSHSVFERVTLSEYVGSEFTAWVIDLPRLRIKEVSTASYEFSKSLKALCLCKGVDKQQVLADFLHDQTYFDNLNNPNFVFAFRPLKSEAHIYGRDCLLQFYSFLTAAYPPSFVPNFSGGSAFHRRDIVAGYKDTNPFVVSICPSCDSQITENQFANREGYTLEHYFHKSEYPAICLHPLNLIPMCAICNNGRGDKDALEPSNDPPIRVSYDEVFHPIKRPARRYVELEYTASTTGLEEMHFIALPDQSKTWTDSIAAYESLYLIPTRWQELRKRIDWRVKRSIDFSMSIYKKYEGEITQDSFVEVINRAIEDLEKNYDHFNYPASRWLKWAKQHNYQRLFQDFVSV